MQMVAVKPSTETGKVLFLLGHAAIDEKDFKASIKHAGAG